MEVYQVTLKVERIYYNWFTGASESVKYVSIIVAGNNKDHAEALARTHIPEANVKDISVVNSTIVTKQKFSAVVEYSIKSTIGPKSYASKYNLEGIEAYDKNEAREIAYASYLKNVKPARTEANEVMNVFITSA
jgi:hypothetical protein